mgnify:CR=1 FL=1
MITVIITTYNRPAHLRLALEAISRQFTQPDEVIIADDGSGEETDKIIQAFALESGMTIAHVWQEHKGFRAAKSRNNALHIANGDFIAFIDQDGLAHQTWLEKHLELHKPGKVNIGGLIMLDEQSSSQMTNEKILLGEFEKMHPDEEENRINRLQRKSNFYSFMRRMRIGIKNKPRLDSGNFAISKIDIEKVNGFDENYTGWGQEDDDIGRRLYLAGIMPNPVINSARVTHLWHKRDASAPQKWAQGGNVEYFTRKYIESYCRNGINKPGNITREPVVVKRYNFD